MRYYTHLLINTGVNPDRPRPSRLWLRNRYHVHQRLCMAFPSSERKQNDPLFLTPYNPDYFPETRYQAEMTREEVGVDVLKQVHTPRNADNGFLYRIDPGKRGRVSILMLSALKPNWDYAFKNAQMFLAAPPQVIDYTPAFKTGEQLHFRIQINLSKKGKQTKNGDSLRKPKSEADRMGRPKDQGKRIALTWNEGENPEDIIRSWFARKALMQLRGAGELLKAFDLLECRVINLGWVMAWKRERTMKFRSAILEGTLQVDNPRAFAQAIVSGLGAAKAFGFGLLSVKLIK